MREQLEQGQKCMVWWALCMALGVEGSGYEVGIKTCTWKGKFSSIPEPSRGTLELLTFLPSQ